MKDKNEVDLKKNRKIKRRNARLYPIYKMFAWDLLFFYSVEFLYLTITKKIDVPTILMINGLYLIFKVIMQGPAATLIDFIGRKKSIVLGNILVIIYLVILIVVPGAIGVIIANVFVSLGFCIKTLAESNLLYDSVSTRGGEGLYSKIDAKGGSWHYLLDGVASMISGYLFVINNYLPMYICLGFVVTATIISFGFKDIYEVKTKKYKKDKDKNKKNFLKQYKDDLRNSFRFITRSKRIRAFMLFAVVFYSVIKIIDVYRSDLLIDIGIPEQQFSLIYAALTLVGAVALQLKETIEKKFKNRTLTFISLVYVCSVVIIGHLAIWLHGNPIIVPIILMMCATQKLSTSTWWVLEYKYLKNFTQENIRTTLSFTYEFVTCTVASICSVLAGFLLKYISIEKATLFVGLVALAFLILVLEYMKTRFGLKPEEYNKKDIEFKIPKK